MSLPSGLSSYELVRALEESKEHPRYFHLRMLKEADGLPKLAPEGKGIFTPVVIADFFGKEGPIEIEIGCGKGGFLVEYCERHPEIPFIGLEWEAEIAHLVAKRLDKRPQLKHTRVLLGDAFYFFRDYLPDNCTGIFHMYFPDPWPKKRHHKNRLMGPAFMELVRQKSIPGATFYWGTDHEEYNGEARALFATLPWLKVVHDNAPPTEGIMTNFEKKYRKQGKPIYRCQLQIQKD